MIKPEIREEHDYMITYIYHIKTRRAKSQNFKFCLKWPDLDEDKEGNKNI